MGFIMEGDEEIHKEFSFVLDDYKTTHWYWEVVELIRKLILSGLIGVFGRGSVAQAAVATLVSFFFFTIVFREMPFISPGLNKIKAFSEFQLFAVLLVCTLMQANLAPAGFAGELIGMDGYGEILKILTMMILPVTLWFTFCAGDADEEKEPELVAKKEAKQAKKLEKKSSRKGAKQKQKDAKLKARAAMKQGKKGKKAPAARTSNPLFLGSDDDDDDDLDDEKQLGASVTNPMVEMQQPVQNPMMAETEAESIPVAEAISDVEIERVEPRADSG